MQLRGTGEVVATDGKQLLIQGGFKFPWKDRVLIPRMGLFGAGVLPEDAPVKIGRSAKHIFIQAGNWTIALTADTQGRYPDVEAVIPRGSGTTWTLSPADAETVVRTLPKMPGLKDDNSPVTVDLNGKVAVRAKDDQDKPVELQLEQSRYNGPATRFCTNRHLLAHALKLGFHEVKIVNPDTPMLCREKDRVFVWMPLAKAFCVAGHPSAMVIRGANKHPSTVNPERRKAAPRKRVKEGQVKVAICTPAAEKPAGLRSLFLRTRQWFAELPFRRRKPG